MTARIGNWISTSTGAEFYPLDAQLDEIFIQDIAGALSKLCRYGGHCMSFYSVAEHCVLLSRFIKEPYKLTALLHDASEAYLVDIPGPIKPFLTNYTEIEDKLMTAIAEKFNFAYPLPDIVKSLDRNMLKDEMEQNMLHTPEWVAGMFPLGIKLQYWSPEQAETEFLKQFKAVYA